MIALIVFGFLAGVPAKAESPIECFDLFSWDMTIDELIKRKGEPQIRTAPKFVEEKGRVIHESYLGYSSDAQNISHIEGYHFYMEKISAHGHRFFPDAADDDRLNEIYEELGECLKNRLSVPPRTLDIKTDEKGFDRRISVWQKDDMMASLHLGNFADDNGLYFFIWKMNDHNRWRALVNYVEHLHRDFFLNDNEALEPWLEEEFLGARQVLKDNKPINFRSPADVNDKNKANEVLGDHWEEFYRGGPPNN